MTDGDYSMDNNMDISAMLDKVLSNPEALSGVMKIVSGLKSSGGGHDNGHDNNNNEEQYEHREQAESREDDAREQDHPGLEEKKEHKLTIGNINLYDEHRIRLLEALRPYLEPSRREKIDYMLNIMKLIKVASASGLLDNLIVKGRG